MSDAGSDATEQSSGRSLSDAESVDPDADAGAAAADNDAAAVGVANVDVDIEQGGLDKTASMGQLLETDLDEESERDDTVDELGHFNVVMRSDRRPTRSLTMARDVDRRFERHEFQHNVVRRNLMPLMQLL